MDKIVKSLENDINTGLSFLNNEYVFVILASLVALYGANARVKLPEFIRNLFENAIFRVVFLSLLLVYNFNKKPQIAVIVSLVFLLTMQYLSQMEIQENFELVEAFQASLQHTQMLEHNM